MNILVTCENFSGGGLETHIHSYYMEMRDRHNFSFAIGSFHSGLPFRAEDIHKGFHFAWESSVAEFVSDVENLVKLIREKEIDVIHAHPFFSLFPSVVASQITGVPVVCTYHGIASFSFSNRINDTILFFYFYSELMSRIFTVSDTGRQALTGRMHVCDAVFLPNAVDMAKYKKHSVVNNRKWAVISRLDADNGKESALKKLFSMFNELDMDEIDIYGDGTRRSELERFVRELGLEERIHFRGFWDDLHERLDGRYNGIIGTDRVAIEGLSMGYPVLSLGYGRICGIYDDKLFELARNCNFDANLMPECSAEALNKQLRQVYAAASDFDYRERMEREFDIRGIAEKYVSLLQDLPFHPHANVIEWFEGLRKLPQQENMYRSQAVFALMKQQIEYYAVIPDVKLLFLLGGECIELRNAIAWMQGEVARIAPPLSFWQKVKKKLGR